MTDMFVRNDIVIPKMVVHGEPIGGIKSGIGSKYVSKKMVDFVQDIKKHPVIQKNSQTDTGR